VSLAQKHKHKKAKLTGRELSDKTLEDYGLSWESLAHSVTIIGWGFNEKAN